MELKERIVRDHDQTEHYNLALHHEDELRQQCQLCRLLVIEDLSQLIESTVMLRHFIVLKLLLAFGFFF